MALNLIYITNNPAVALIAEKHGVDTIMVDLETLGKEERQKDMNTVKSNHTVTDVRAVSDFLTTAEMLVRVNPWNPTSVGEIESVIASGAQRIMLPMWKTVEEVELFLNTVNKRVHTTLLLETKEAVECLDEILENPLVEEIYIGLNDLHLSYGLTFMFELLTNGKVDALCEKCKKKGIPFGFGGVARIGEGTLPAERIVMEHYRLGSSKVILSRSFCNIDENSDLQIVDDIFTENIARLRNYEEMLCSITENEFEENRLEVDKCVNEIVRKIKENQV